MIRRGGHFDNIMQRPFPALYDGAHGAKAAATFVAHARAPGAKGHAGEGAGERAVE